MNNVILRQRKTPAPTSLTTLFSSLHKAQFNEISSKQLEFKVLKASSPRNKGRCVVVGGVPFVFDADGICKVDITNTSVQAAFDALCRQNGVSKVVETVATPVVATPEPVVKKEPIKLAPFPDFAAKKPTVAPIVEVPKEVVETSEEQVSESVKATPVQVEEPATDAVPTVISGEIEVKNETNILDEPLAVSDSVQASIEADSVTTEEPKKYRMRRKGKKTKQ